MAGTDHVIPSRSVGRLNDEFMRDNFGSIVSRLAA